MQACLCHRAVLFGIGLRAVMLCGWEDNHRSRIPLAARQDNSGIPDMNDKQTCESSR